MRPYNRNSSGYILPIVLFLVIILTGGGVFALHIAKQEIKNTADLFDSAEAQIEAESQLEVIKFYIASGRFTLNRIENDSLINNSLDYPSILYLDNREHNISKSIRIRLQDTAGFLNAMYPDAQAISDLLSYTEDFHSSATLIESVADWFDKDDLHRINGAEAEYYTHQKLPYAPRNGQISFSKEELHLIRGLRDLTNEQWNYVSRFMVLSPVSAFNYTTAPPELLAAKLHVSVKELDGLEQLRRKDLDAFLNRIRLIGTGYNPETASTFPSGVIAVEIKSQRNNTSYTLSSIIDFSDYDDAPIHTISRH